jgi:probable phosphoglycerate mutase
MIYLMRHGQTHWNAEQRFQGWQDSPLTERGQAQARAAGRLLRDLAVDTPGLTVISSPLGRARQTATLVLEELGLAPEHMQTDERLKEVGLGAWEGMLDAVVERDWAELHAARRADPWNVPPPGGETHDDVMNRVADWLAEQSEERPLLIVTHGVAGRILRGVYLKLTRSEIRAQPTFGQDELHVLADGEYGILSTTDETAFWDD